VEISHLEFLLINPLYGTKAKSGGEMYTIRIAKSIMKMFERYPHFSEDSVGELNEIFNHEIFLSADDYDRKSIMYKSSESKYKSEIQYPWDNYFGFNLKPLLQGKTALDLGCFNGGRSLAWYERYGLQQISGIDIKEVYIEAANQFGSTLNANTDFRKGTGESLPFKDETFDAILTFDVFEHVKNIQKTLRECYRVLKNGGRLFLVFPSYFHPVEHHLSLVTVSPCIHWFFSGKTLMKAYCEILEERGDDAYWYKRSSPFLESWEKCNSINGTTFSQFKRLIRTMNWQIFREVHKPLGSVGRNITRYPLAKIGGKLFLPLTFLPVLQELFLHRITFILEKRTQYAKV
jgi:ubiquinone/menaquinone biosynthesis C-methylase UbiE